MMRWSALALSLLLAVLLACKKSDSGNEGSPCKSDQECKNGLLCESVCIQADKAKKIREPAVTQQSAPPPVTASTAPPPAVTAPPPTDGISRMSGAGMKSKVPTLSEWNEMGECTVAHSTPLGCETKMVREWLRVSCRTTNQTPHQIQGVKLVKDTGLAKYEVFTYTHPGVASVVMPIRGGLDARVEFTWSDWGKRTLIAQMAHGAKLPSINFDAPPPK
jgi:hypothetical protein